MGEHTKLPWTEDLKPLMEPEFPDLYLRGYSAGNYERVPVYGFALSSSDEARANGAFIFKACNAHDGLVAEVSELRALSIESNQLAADNFKRAKIAEAERDAMAKALEPFAAFADPRNTIPPDTILTAGSAMARKQITMADCYAARDAIAKAKP